MRQQRLAVLNSKGGVGKSTIAFHLAAQAVLEGKRTRLIDGDVQGSCMKWGRHRRPGSRLADLDIVHSYNATRSDLDVLSEGFEVVILDGSGRTEALSLAAAEWCDLVLVPMRATVLDFEADENNRPVWQLAANRAGKQVRYVYALNHLSSTGGTADVLAVAQAIIAEGASILPVGIPSLKLIERVPGYGEVAMTMEPKGKAATRFVEMYRAIMTLMGGTTEVAHA